MEVKVKPVSGGLELEWNLPKEELVTRPAKEVADEFLSKAGRLITPYLFPAHHLLNTTQAQQVVAEEEA